MTTNSTHELQVQIERLVREHLAAQHVAAAAAVERAFAGAGAASKVASARRPAGTRRAVTEVSALADRLYEAVRAHPGEPMNVKRMELASLISWRLLPRRGLRRRRMPRLSRIRSSGA